MRTFKFTEGDETKTVDAVSYKKAVKSYQSSSKGNVVHVEWPGSKGGTFEKNQKLPLGRSKKMRQISNVGTWGPQPSNVELGLNM